MEEKRTGSEKEREETRKKKVMVAIDESEYSYYALQWTLDNLSLSDSELLIFTVQPIANYSFTYASTFGSAPLELIMSIQENQKKVALSLLERAKKICAEHGIVAETQTESGDPKEVICQVVEKLNVQLLILGSHGRGALGRTFIGSVSNYCVHNTKCNVLVVKKPA